MITEMRVFRKKSNFFAHFRCRKRLPATKSLKKNAKVQRPVARFWEPKHVGIRRMAVLAVTLQRRVAANPYLLPPKSRARWPNRVQVRPICGRADLAGSKIVLFRSFSPPPAPPPAALPSEVEENAIWAYECANTALYYYGPVCQKTDIRGVPAEGWRGRRFREERITTAAAAAAAAALGWAVLRAIHDGADASGTFIAHSLGW